MRRTVAVAGGAAALAAAVALYFAYSGREPGAIALRPDDEGLVRKGAAIYRAQCASCHGERLEGQPDWRTRLPNGRLPAPPHDATGHTWHHPDAVLFALTKHGPAAMVGGDYRSDMPAYADVLTDAEIRAVLSYIKSRWPAGIRRRHDQINARSR